MLYGILRVPVELATTFVAVPAAIAEAIEEAVIGDEDFK
jgi:hypothetical protein